MIFPLIHTEDEFTRWASQEAAREQTLHSFLRHVGVQPSALAPIPGGTNLLYALGQGRVLKLCPPPFAQDAQVELALLQAGGLASLGLEAPRLLEHGQVEGWSWMVMTRLEGVCGWDAWEVMDRQERRRAARALGAWVQAFYRDASVQAAQVPAGRRSWEATWTWLHQGMVEKHRRSGASQAWLERLGPALEGWTSRGTPRLVHADLHPGNLLFRESEQGWVLTGVVDFADATWAPPLYDLAAPALFLSQGDAVILDLLAEAFDGAPCGVAEAWRWILLHQFSGLGWCVKESGLGEEGSMEALARALLG